MARLILDADGVFLDETPYWTVALATALEFSGVGSQIRDWARLETEAFHRGRLQHVTKLRGCNSNWDLAAVLMRAVDRAVEHRNLGALIAAEAYGSLASVLREIADAMWSWPPPPDCLAPDDPLSGFGIDRYSPDMDEVIDAYQEIFHDASAMPGADFERYRLRHSPEETLEAFTQCAAAGFELAICTGRIHEEIVEPLRRFHLDGYIDGRHIVCDDTVVRAQRLLDVAPLCKPHWFSAMCAATDVKQAMDCVRRGAVPELREPVIYVGDGLSDFESVRACVERGLALRYIHVQSLAGSAKVDEQARAAPFTLAVVPSLLHVPDHIRGVSL